MEDHHCPMVDGKSSEAAFELVAIDDRAQALRHPRLIGRKESDVRRPTARPATLGVAGAHEEPVRPGVKARRVAELGKVSPDGQQRLLARIFGEVGVAQDPERHRVEAVANGDGEAREGLLVTVLRPSDQICIHVSSAVVAPGRSGRFIRYGRSLPFGDSMFAAEPRYPPARILDAWSGRRTNERRSRSRTAHVRRLARRPDQGAEERPSGGHPAGLVRRLDRLADQGSEEAAGDAAADATDAAPSYPSSASKIAPITTSTDAPIRRIASARSPPSPRRSVPHPDASTIADSRSGATAVSGATLKAARIRR